MTGLYAFTPEQEELRSVVRSLLAEDGTARSLYDGGGHAPDRALWARLAELGVTGLGIPEDLGGSGGDLIDQLVVAEELGRAVAPVGFVATAVATACLGDDASCAEVLAGIASGSTIVGVAVDDPSMAYDCAGADLLVVADADGVALVASPAVGALRSIDRTRPLSECSWDPGAATPVIGAPTVAQLRALQWTLYAAEAVGVAAAALDQTAVYTRDRHQFGLPIGTFQAVKHRLADMLVQVECARSAAHAAAWAIRDGADGILPAHLAQAVATEAAIEVVSAAVQLHGGIGVTWEHDLHLHLRRAKSLELVHGSPGWHYDQIATALLGPIELA